jgi:hypothetical protein
VSGVSPISDDHDQSFPVDEVDVGEGPTGLAPSTISAAEMRAAACPTTSSSCDSRASSSPLGWRLVRGVLLVHRRVAITLAILTIIDQVGRL